MQARAPRRRPKRAVKRVRTRLETDERRKHLLELSMTAFAEHSYDDVSIDDIARAAGVSKGLLYHYFPTKRDFYIAGLREASRRLIDITTTSPEGATPLERMRHGVDTYLAYVAQHARGYTALLRGGVGSDPIVAKVIEETRNAYVARLLEGADGAPLTAAAAKQPIIRITLRGWLGFVEAASLDWVEKRDVVPRQVRDLLVDLLIVSLKLASGAPLTRDW